MRREGASRELERLDHARLRSVAIDRLEWMRATRSYGPVPASGGPVTARSSSVNSRRHGLKLMSPILTARPAPRQPATAVTI